MTTGSIRNQKRTRRAFIAGTAMLGLGSVLAACAPAPTPTPVPKPPAAPTATAAPKPAAAPTAPPAPQPTAKPVAAAPTAAPTPVPQPTPVSKPAAVAPVSIRISVWPSAFDKEVYDAIVVDFNKANEGKIKLTGEDFVGNYMEKLQITVAGGTAPDVLYIMPFDWQEYVLNGHHVALDDYRKRDNWNAPWPDLPMYKYYCYWEGKTYMAPADTGISAIFYLPELFDKAGVPHPKDGWTNEDLIEKAIKLTDAKAKIFGFQTQGWVNFYFPFWRAEGVLEYDKMVEPVKANWNDPVIVDLCQKIIVEGFNKHKFMPTPQDLGGGTIGLARGNVAIFYDGSWSLPPMWGARAVKPGGVNYEVVTHPVGKKGGRAAWGNPIGHGIFSKSKQQDEAWQLIKFITSDDGQKHIPRSGRMNNTPDMIQKHWVRYARENFNVKNPEVFIESMKVGASLAVTTYGRLEITNKALGPAFDKMLKGTSAKEALDEANPIIQQLLDARRARK
ncbi:MAG: sugar ABC transporter substrate-binding protein [Chloroflexi bacterium]|nr:sugar ABC transporter substrate-binding protein [Chloroflexota bacterium]